VYQTFLLFNYVLMVVYLSHPVVVEYYMNVLLSRQNNSLSQHQMKHRHLLCHLHQLGK
jgi:hypothetical protein